jgi:hypothetical protein
MDLGLGHYPPVLRHGRNDEHKVDAASFLQMHVHLHVYSSNSR